MKLSSIFKRNKEKGGCCNIRIEEMKEESCCSDSNSKGESEMNKQK